MLAVQDKVDHSPTDVYQQTFHLLISWCEKEMAWNCSLQCFGFIWAACVLWLMMSESELCILYFDERLQAMMKLYNPVVFCVEFFFLMSSLPMQSQWNWVLWWHVKFMLRQVFWSVQNCTSTAFMSMISTFYYACTWHADESSVCGDTVFCVFLCLWRRSCDVQTCASGCIQLELLPLNSKAQTIVPCASNIDMFQCCNSSTLHGIWL